MSVFAPGKLVLTGAYAVLHGAPAIVVATSRGAIADATRVAPSATPEVRAALGDSGAPHVDASSMFVGGRKLGLGASAAILVASVAARDVERGADISSAETRALLFARARKAHAEAQSGGSGVDVAASVYGGALAYRIETGAAPIVLPPRLHLAVFACGTSARTSDLRAEVARLAASQPKIHASCMDAIGVASASALAACSSDDLAAFVTALDATARALDALGNAAGIGIVPEGFLALADLARAESAAFSVSGAGGGDVAVFAGEAPPSPTFLERAKTLGLFLLPLDLDEKGVRVVSRTAAHLPDAAGPEMARLRS